MPVGMIFDSGQVYSGRAYPDAIAAARSHRVPVVLGRRGMRWTSGDGVTIDVLAPSLPFLSDTGDDVNENSIVVMLRYRTFRELFRMIRNFGSKETERLFVRQRVARFQAFERVIRMAKTLAPVHPGEVLAEAFMAPVGLTANQLTLSLRIPANRIAAIIAGKRGITAEVWMGLQAEYDLQMGE